MFEKSCHDFARSRLWKLGIMIVNTCHASTHSSANSNESPDILLRSSCIAQLAVCIPQRIIRLVSLGKFIVICTGPFDEGTATLGMDLVKRLRCYPRLEARAVCDEL
ncbi:hypothetical protein CERZMDRAFT_120750 [Cercospora zeae-maydis SCOH1-5]|uniref:Uncharacterized protein n=1 Tax=Cercospora zeae-maydis SCOH1-5 TaxID=717836 RepID=A0A6A6FIY3_9PEZI|nr:hypothetical protein CERZMDRAFT_120750 [Cercospora zeae-maydis SCOH1-5]